MTQLSFLSIAQAKKELKRDRYEGSYNIEDTVVITEDGHERFTYANESFDWSGE